MLTVLLGQAPSVKVPMVVGHAAGMAMTLVSYLENGVTYAFISIF